MPASKPFSGTIDPNRETTRSNGRALMMPATASDMVATNMSHAGWSREAIADLVARQAAASTALTTAFAQCPAGLQGLAQALAMYDDGLSTAENTLEAVRHVLGIAKPVIPGSVELGRDWAALYQGLPPGTASGSAVGG